MTTALNVSVLNSLVPVLIVAAGALLFRDRIAIVQIVGIATSLIGVIVIVTRAQLDTLVRLAFSRGDLIIVLNMTIFAIYAAYLRLRPPIHWLSFMFMLAVISASATLPFFIWESWSGFTFQPTLLTVVASCTSRSFPASSALPLGIAASNSSAPTAPAPSFTLSRSIPRFSATGSWAKRSHPITCWDFC